MSTSESGRRRVLLVVEQLRRLVPGGIGTYAQGLLSGLLDNASASASGDGVELELLASRASRQLLRDNGSDPLADLGLPMHTPPIGSRLLTRGWDIGMFPVRAEVDVVHAVSLAVPPVLPRADDSPRVVVSVHDLAWRRHPEAATSRGRHWHEAALQRALRHASAFMVPSDTVAEELIAAGASGEQTFVIPLGCDHLPPPDMDGAQTVLAQHGVSGEYWLTVGTLEPRKNLGRLFEAYRLAHEQLGDGRPLVVVGPRGWGKGERGAHAIPEGVTSTGPVSAPTLAGLYESARAFVYVPLSEGYGLPPLEAMAHGLPVVTSTTVPSVVTHGSEYDGAAPDNAQRVDPLDVDAIAQALVAVDTDEGLRSTLIDAGRRLAARRTWLRTARAHIDMWDAIG